MLLFRFVCSCRCVESNNENAGCVKCFHLLALVEGRGFRFHFTETNKDDVILNCSSRKQFFWHF